MNEKERLNFMVNIINNQTNEYIGNLKEQLLISEKVPLISESIEKRIEGENLSEVGHSMKIFIKNNITKDGTFELSLAERLVSGIFNLMEEPKTGGGSCWYPDKLKSHTRQVYDRHLDEWEQTKLEELEDLYDEKRSEYKATLFNTSDKKLDAFLNSDKYSFCCALKSHIEERHLPTPPTGGSDYRPSSNSKIKLG